MGDAGNKKYAPLGETDGDFSDDDDHNDVHDGPGSAAAASGGGSIFRSPGSPASLGPEETAMATTSPPRDGHRHHHKQHLEHHRAANSSFEGIDDDDWEEEDANLRRYHLDFKADVPANFRPAEFESMPKRIWLQFLDLRTAARQRQAARLLNMPSESFQYRCHSFCMTLCDATDQGILLVVACLTLWLLVGLAARAGALYWLTGIAVFGVRVSARRIVEYLQGSRLRQRRLRLSSVELGGASYRETNAKDDSEHENGV